MTSPPSPRGAQSLRALRHLAAGEITDLVSELAAELGDLFVVRAGPMELWFLSAPRHVEQILVTNAAKYRKSRLLGELRHVTGNGLLISEGDDWRRQRRAANPSLSRPSVRALAPVVVECAGAVRAHFAAMPDGAEVDLAVEMVQAALTILLRTMFSGQLERSVDEIHHAVSTAMREVSRRIVSPVKFPLGWPLPGNRRLRDAVAVLDDEIGRILADRRGRPESGDDLLGRLMASGAASEQELRDHCVTMFVAGHDTVAMAMTWAFYLLALHPEAEERLHAEATRVIGDGPLRAEHIEQLQYASQVIDEALRLYPQPGTLFRTPLEDDVVDGHHVPAGAEVVLSIHTLHRAPALWPEPLVFRPERFAPDEVALRDRHAFVPFGAGQRACVGKAFAQQEAAALVALLARDFRFELAVDPPVATEIAAVTAPRGGLPVRVRHRVTSTGAAPPGR